MNGGILGTSFRFVVDRFSRISSNKSSSLNDFNNFAFFQEFRKAVMQFAGIESETDQPVAILSQILCTTPR